MSNQSENLEKLRKLERITQESPGDFIPMIFPSINSIRIIEKEKPIAHAILDYNGENRLLIPEMENYESAKELANLYQEKAHEMGIWKIYLNKKRAPKKNGVIKLN